MMIYVYTPTRVSYMIYGLPVTPWGGENFAIINTLKHAKHAPRVGFGVYSQYFWGNLLL